MYWLECRCRSLVPAIFDSSKCSEQSSHRWAACFTWNEKCGRTFVAIFTLFPFDERTQRNNSAQNKKRTLMDNNALFSFVNAHWLKTSITRCLTRHKFSQFSHSRRHVSVKSCENSANAFFHRIETKNNNLQCLFKVYRVSWFWLCAEDFSYNI